MILDLENGPNPSGLCMCGCGRRTNITRQTQALYGSVKGKPRRYVHGHQGRKAEYYTDEMGYRRRYRENGDIVDRRREHQIVYEKHYGPVAAGLLIHHIDGDRTNNAPENLVALTMRDHMRTHSAGWSLRDSVWWHRCTRCGVWDMEQGFYVSRSGKVDNLCKPCARKRASYLRKATVPR